MAVTQVKFNNSLQNATMNIDSETMYNVGETVHIEVVANTNFSYPETTTPYLSYSNTTFKLTSTDETRTKFTGDFTIPTLTNANVYVYGKATLPNGKTAFKEIDITFCTCNVNTETLYDEGEIVHVEIKANSGYYFSTAPYISYSSKSGVSKKQIMMTDETGDYPTTFYLDYTMQSFNVQNNKIYANAQVKPQTDKYGIITIYNPTPSELKEIGNVRYMNNVDLGNYISNLIKVYVKIPKEDIATVLLGGYNTGVQSNVVVTDIIETDCSSVEIVGNYNNAMDYENTTVEMYLPFVGFVQLDTVKVMNETLKLIYKTNVINGDTIACLYNTTGTLLYTYNTTASFEIPYKLNAVNEPQGQLNVNSNYLFGFTPFITVRYNKALNSSNVVANDDRLTTLENEIGFVRCSEVFNTINATTNEKEEIETLLKGGVIL